MAIAYYTQFALFKELTGLSSDTKPTPTVGETWTFFETDTSKFYRYDNGWVESINSAYGTSAAVGQKAPINSPTFTGTVSGVTKTMIGLGNVTNTSDANKPVSTAQQTALDLKEDEANKGAANGYAPLGADSKVPLTNIPIGVGVGDVIGPTGATGDRVVLFDGITGKLIKDSGLTLAGTNTGDQTLAGLGGVPTSRTLTINGTAQDLSANRSWTVNPSITQAEIDVGATPVAEATVAVTDAGISTSSKIIGGLAYIAPTDKDLDELEMDALDILFEPGTGSMNVLIKGLEGYIADKFKIWYMFA